LKQHARKSVAEVAYKVSTADREAGRILADLDVSMEQWEHSKQILEALHDKRVQDIGSSVQDAVRSSATVDEAAMKIADEEDHFRALRDQFVPPSLQDVADLPGGQNHWSASMEHGQMQMSGAFGDWQASVAMGDEAATRRLMDNITESRRLMSKTALIIAAVVVSVLGILMTVLTATMGPAASMVLFFISAGVDALVCAGAVGAMAQGVRGFLPWLPCAILSAFTGLEAIWTFRKPKCSKTCKAGGIKVDKKCYYMIAPTVMMTWDQSKAACKNDGAILASFHSQNDYNAGATLTTAAAGKPAINAWIGGWRTCTQPVNAPKCTTWSWEDRSNWWTPANYVVPPAPTPPPPPPAGAAPTPPPAAGDPNMMIQNGGLWAPKPAASQYNAICQLWMC
jgi:hypothetical protein